MLKISESAPRHGLPNSLRQLVPGRHERALIVGHTGSGKTTLAERLLWYHPYVVAFDVKRRLQWQGYERHTALSALQQSEHTHLIYAPGVEEFDNEDVWEAFFRWCYEREHTMLYVDEAMMVTNGEVMPRWYKAILTLGRELEVGCISSTQRPKRIPQVLLSEADHYFAFELRLEQDRQRLEEVSGFTFPELAPESHQFAYLKPGRPAGIFKLDVEGSG